jgi:hypothetical protein
MREAAYMMVIGIGTGLGIFAALIVAALVIGP